MSLATDGQEAIVERHVEVLGLHAPQIGLERKAVVVLYYGSEVPRGCAMMQGQADTRPSCRAPGSGGPGRRGRFRYAGVLMDASWRGREVDLERQWLRLAVLVLVLAGVAAYANSLWGPFIFDDRVAIQENSSIRDLGALGRVLGPLQPGVPQANRPVLNLTFALNYALGGLNVVGYHATNLLIHILAAVTLFGVCRRTFLQPALRPRWGTLALPLAFMAALLWELHPLQTEAVTYITQRSESLMGLLYLFTLYAAIRAAGAARSSGWSLAAVGACAAGMATKEVMVSAPIMVLLYDRALLAGSFRGALRRRWGLYAGLAATWLVLALILWAAKGRNGVAAGFGLGMNGWEYGL
jgi:hypothetical protein